MNKIKNIFKILYNENYKQTDITTRIEKLAKEIIRSFVIKSNYNMYKIVECEVYLNGCNSKYGIDHTDKYTHSKPQQLLFGNWYDHPAGIDFTIGDNEKVFGGLLIRSIKNINSGQFINGPLNTKEELFSKFKNKAIAIENLKLDSISNSENSNLEIFKVIRFGLSKNPSVKCFDNFEMYRIKKYRFITDFTPLNKIKVKETILDQLLDDKQINWERVLKKDIISYVPKKLKEKYDQR